MKAKTQLCFIFNYFYLLKYIKLIKLNLKLEILSEKIKFEERFVQIQIKADQSNKLEKEKKKLEHSDKLN